MWNRLRQKQPFPKQLFINGCHFLCFANSETQNLDGGGQFKVQEATASISKDTGMGSLT